MYGYIYKTTNLINGKIYIGQKKANEFLGRTYLGSGKKLKYAINKYGAENFKVELLEEVDSKDALNTREIYWIKKFNSTNTAVGYNIAKGGNGGDIFSKLTSDQQKEFNRKSNVNAGKVGVFKQGVLKYIEKSEIDSYLNLGYSLSKHLIKEQEMLKKKELAEHKEEEERLSWKLGKHLCMTCGKPMYQKYGSGKYCCKSCAVTHKHNEATKQKLSKLNSSGICGNKGKHFSEEHKKKISKAKKGKKMSEETKKKCSEANKGKIPWNKGLNISDARVRKNIEKRNETMLKKYNTLNIYAIKNKGGK